MGMPFCWLSVQLLVSSIIFNSFSGGPDSPRLEIITNGLGFVLFLAVGGVAVNFYSKNLSTGREKLKIDIWFWKNPSTDSGAGYIGVLSILTAVVFLADFIVTCKKEESKNSITRYLLKSFRTQSPTAEVGSS